MAVAIPSVSKAAARRRRVRRQIPATIALLPAALVVIVVYLGCMLWTVRLSFTSSKLLPKLDFIGFAQYERLFTSSRFLISIENLVVFGVLFLIGCLVIGFLLAVFIDQRVRAEGIFRTVYLYPYALSFIVTGLIWQWFLNPTFGLQKIGRDLGFESITFDWLVNRDMAIYTVVIAAIWQSAGLVMAILLASLRGVDNEIYRAARVDGGGFWTNFLRVLLPMSTPMVIVAVILQVTGIWNDFILGLVFAGRDNLPMTVQLNNTVNSSQGKKLYNVNMAATMLTGLVPLFVYFISGRWFVRGIAAGAVKG